MESSDTEEVSNSENRSHRNRKRQKARSQTSTASARRGQSSKTNQRRNKIYELKIPEEAGTAGQLLRVKLLNFMCHENFEIYFGPHVNFISGKNGSGKSAILQAIQLCCGNTARNTGRGSNLSNFIRTGCTSGKILVSLWNTGPEGYHRHIYGRVITIERSIASTSGYSIINEHGQPISSKKSEVDAIVQYFGIVCRNPSVILTQGAAATFLRGKYLPSDLYSLYMKVTEFEATVEKHNEAALSLEASRTMINEERDRTEEMKSQREDLSERTKRAKEGQTASIRLQHFQNVVLYLEVSELDEKVSEQQRCIDQQQERIGSVEADMKLKQDYLDDIGRQREAFNEEHRVEEVRGLLDNLKREQTQLAIQKKMAEKECKEPKRCISELESEMDSIRITLENRKRKLENLKEDDGAKIQQAKKAFEESIVQKEEFVQQKEAELMTAKQSINEVDALVDNTKKEAEVINESYRETQAEISRLKSDLENLQQGQSDPVKKFGGEAARLLYNAIHRHKLEFHHLPIGPIGSYLNVKDDVWSKALEFAIGRLFNAFIVHNIEDERKVRNLNRQHNRNYNPYIIVYSFDRAPYTFKQYENSPQLTIMKVLQFMEFDKSDILKNILIDYGRIEKTGLCHSETEALTTINDRSRLISTVWLPTGRRVYRNKNGLGSLHDGRNLQPRLVKDTSRQFKRTQTELQQMKTALNSINHKKMEVEGKLRALMDDHKEAQQAMRRVEMELQELEDELHEMKEKGPELPASARDDVRLIQQDIKDLERRLQLQEKKIEGKEQELKYKEDAVESIEGMILEKRKILEQKAEDVKEMKNEVEKLNEIYQQAEGVVDRFKRQLEVQEEKKSELQSTMDQLTEKKEDVEKRAKDKCDEKEFEESLEALKSWCLEINAPESQLTASTAKSQITILTRLVINLQMNENENYEELLAEREKLEERLRKQLSLIMDQENALEEAEAGFTQREELYKKQQETMDKSINQHFKRYMKKRGHTGKISLDHQSQLVNILVRMAGQEETAKDMASLSGGERSYTTVALLLAFGSIVESPFHCMDEFDVFTDALTKHYSMMVLLETAATEKLTSQFILFSPQDVAALEDAKHAVNQQYQQKTGQVLIPDNFVMIYTMAPPIR